MGSTTSSLDSLVTRIKDLNDRVEKLKEKVHGKEK